MSDSDLPAVSERAAALWRAYLAGLQPDHPHRTALITEFSFGDSPAMADELAALVVSGRKQVTATLAIQFAVEGAPLPAVGYRRHGVRPCRGRGRSLTGLVARRAHGFLPSSARASWP